MDANDRGGGFPPAAASRGWGWWLAAMAVLALVPFMVAAIPSMTDLPGHIGRYAVMADGGRSPALAAYYDFHWRLVGNLGVDLLVWPLAPPIGVERAAALVSAGIAPLSLGGIAALSRALHGRIQPTAIVAGCFVLANPLMYGFVNYCLSFALALFAFAGWIALRERPWPVQLAAMTPAVLIVWLAHAMGWGVLVILIGGWELARLVRRPAEPMPLAARLADAAVRCLALLPPLILTIAWRSDSTGGAAFVYASDILMRKAMNWIVMLRGADRAIDLAVPAILALALAAGLWLRALRPDPGGATGAFLLALASLVLPTTLLGSWGADERIVPAAVIAAIVSLRWQGGRRATRAGALALAGLAMTLFAGRTLFIAAQWDRLDGAYAAHLAGLDRVPRGARIQAIVLVDGCRGRWAATAYTHLPSLAIGRREALVNTQWPLQGAALLRVRPALDPRFAHDPSQMVTGFDCAGPLPAPAAARAAALMQGPSRGQWQYLWVLDTRGTDPWPGRAPLYRDSGSALYRL